MGRIISFTGIDGAGKSTQVKLLSEYLASKNKRFEETEEMFTYFLLKPIIKYLRRSTKSPQGGPVTRNKKLLPKLWFVPAFFDIWIGYLVNILPKKMRLDYIIADRFYTDIWANLLYYGYIPRWAYRVFIHLLPPSDIPFIFFVKPGTVRKREEDFPLSYYEEQSVIYSELATLVKNFPVDANREPKTVFKDIKKHIK